MQTKLSTGAMIAAAAAAFALSAAAGAATPPKGSKGKAIDAGDKVHCYNVHDCKGNSDCKTSEHSCKGQNACKGQGFKSLAAGECLKKAGTIGDL